MDHDIERSNWRTHGSRRSSDPADELPRVVETEQDDDLAASPTGAGLSRDLSAACLRSCAARCRAFAARQPDPGRAELFRGLAASFDRHASVKERRLASHDI
jgi:hypothetical protein